MRHVNGALIYLHIRRWGFCSSGNVRAQQKKQSVENSMGALHCKRGQCSIAKLYSFIYCDTSLKYIYSQASVYHLKSSYLLVALQVKSEMLGWFQLGEALMMYQQRQKKDLLNSGKDAYKKVVDGEEFPELLK